MRRYGAQFLKVTRVLVMFASANRDERAWSDPDRFDITRDASHQLGFGHGVHACAGQGLARMETEKRCCAHCFGTSTASSSTARQSWL